MNNVVVDCDVVRAQYGKGRKEGGRKEALLQILEKENVKR
jgi:hypothetical protein